MSCFTRIRVQTPWDGAIPVRRLARSVTCGPIQDTPNIAVRPEASSG